MAQYRKSRCCYGDCRLSPLVSFWNRFLILVMRKLKKLGVVYISYYVPSRLCSCHCMGKAIIFRDKVTCVVTNNIICFLYLCWGKSLTRPRKFCHDYGSLVKKRLHSLMKLRLSILQVKTACRRISLSKLFSLRRVYSVHCTLYFVPCLD